MQTKYTYKILKKDEALEPKYANKVRTTFNRPLALRGHVTNAAFKQWVGTLLMPKIEGAHKIILRPRFERKRI